MTATLTPPAAGAGAGFLEERLCRIALTGIPSFEADLVKKICGSAPAEGVRPRP